MYHAQEQLPRTMSTNKLRDSQKYPPAVLELILSIMHRMARPVYLGIISLEVGWSLARTQQMFDELEERGEVRPATLLEKREHGMRTDATVYTLTGPAMISKARW